ncbi:hypothetical protein LINPERPRIM_LOCUS16627, partial [Linum perenne]
FCSSFAGFIYTKSYQLGNGRFLFQSSIKFDWSQVVAAGELELSHECSSLDELVARCFESKLQEAMNQIIPKNPEVFILSRLSFIRTARFSHSCPNPCC